MSIARSLLVAQTARTSRHQKTNKRPRMPGISSTRPAARPSALMRSFFFFFFFKSFRTVSSKIRARFSPPSDSLRRIKWETRYAERFEHGWNGFRTDRSSEPFFEQTRNTFQGRLTGITSVFPHRSNEPCMSDDTSTIRLANQVATSLFDLVYGSLSRSRTCFYEIRGEGYIERDGLLRNEGFWVSMAINNLREQI